VATLKIVTSQVWCHRFTWRRRWRHQSTCRRHFPTGSLLDTNPLNRLVSEIFCIKVVDKQTHKQIVRQTDRETDVSTDNKGCLKLGTASQ